MKTNMLMNLICGAATLLSVQGLALAWGGIPAKKSTFAARHAFQMQLREETGTMPTGGDVHSHTVGSASKSYRKVMVWQGAERGPGAKKTSKVAYDVRLAMVPKNRDLTPTQRAENTLLTGDLTAKGAALVKAHLLSQGLKPTSIQLGDFVKPMQRSVDGSEIRLSQKPIARASGNLRYTATFPDGTKVRYLVETSGKKVLQGRNPLGKVFTDTDYYRETSK